MTCDCELDTETWFEKPGPICHAREMKEWSDAMDRWEEVKEDFLAELRGGKYDEV